VKKLVLLENHFPDDPRGRRIEVRRLNRRRLFELSIALGISRDERCALLRVLGFDIATDGAALKKDEPVIVLVADQEIWRDDGLNETRTM
jgi:hypothetical protein